MSIHPTPTTLLILLILLLVLLAISIAIQATKFIFLLGMNKQIQTKLSTIHDHLHTNQSSVTDQLQNMFKDCDRKPASPARVESPQPAKQPTTKPRFPEASETIHPYRDLLEDPPDNPPATIVDMEAHTYRPGPQAPHDRGY